MEEGPSGSLEDSAAPSGEPSASSDAERPDWAAVRAELEVFAILTQSLTDASRQVIESLGRLERDSVDRYQDLEARLARLEGGHAARPEELEHVRRQIEAERLSGQDGEREAGAREATEQQVSATIAAAQRRADELLATAQHRAAEIERVALERRAGILAESEDLERQIRHLHERIGQLLERSGPAADVAAGAGGPESRSLPGAGASFGQSRAEEAPSAASRAEVGEPLSAVDSGPATGEAGESGVTASGPTGPSAETAEAAGPVTITLVFDNVPGFQAVLGLERALKAMPRTRDVAVGDFDERRLTMHVTHELGEDLPREISALENLDLELVRAEADRAEFRFTA